MTNAYEKFYHGLNTYFRKDGSLYVAQHKDLSLEYIKKTIDSIFVRNKYLKENKKVILSIFGFDGLPLEQVQVLSNYEIEQDEFHMTINMFIKAFLLQIYFRKVFLIVFIYNFILYSTLITLFEYSPNDLDIRKIIITAIVYSILTATLKPYIDYKGDTIQKKRRDLFALYQNQY